MEALINRRESLVLTAIDIINELGIQGLSTREVAKRQNMSNAAIFSHFKSKNELIEAVLDYYIKYDPAILQAINSNNLNPIQAIIYYIDSFATYYENYPAITSIMQIYDFFQSDPFFSDKVKNIFFSRTEHIRKMAVRAQSEKLLKNNIDASVLSNIIIGTFGHICLEWRMNKYGFPLKQRMLNAINMILEEFSTKP